LFAEVQQFNGAVFGVCGGYQMLCQMLHDPDALEHDEACTEIGLGLLDDEVVYQSPKILQRGLYELFSYSVQGYEIHCGRMANYPLYYQQGQVAGTHVHGVFDHDEFRTDYLKPFILTIKVMTTRRIVTGRFKALRIWLPIIWIWMPLCGR